MTGGGIAVSQPLNPWQCHADRLRDSVRAALRPGRPVVLVDLPPYLNIGDSLIALGAMSLLRCAEVDLRGVYGGTFPRRAIEEVDRCGGTIIINGGGNLGSIWPDQQALKTRLATECRRARIVQLPQSIHFDAADQAAAAFAAFRGHPDFVLFVRDEPSRDLAVGHGLEQVGLAIDTAFLVDVGRRRQPVADSCLLARTDRERRFDTPRLAAELARCGSAIECDWAAYDDLPATVPRLRVEVDKMGIRILVRWSRYGQFLGGATAASAWFSNRLEIGKRTVCAGRVLVTDRLHAHILAVLLGQPHVWLDNSYGKIARFAAAWDTASPVARRAGSEEEAVALAAELLGESVEARGA